MENTPFQADSFKRNLFQLDPRTKLLMLVMSALFVLSRIGGSRMDFFRIAMIILPYLLLLIEREYQTVSVNLLLLLLFSAMAAVPRYIQNTFVCYVCVMMSGVFLRLLPAIAAAKYVVKTTKISEFTAGMERMHVPEKLIIPASVMFRFMPTVAEEFRFIGDAMDMRQIRITGSKAFEVFEFRLVPMLICSVRIGEDLSAAAVTRGLGSGVKRTNICRIGFHRFDYLLFIFYAAAIVKLILSLAGVTA